LELEFQLKLQFDPAKKKLLFIYFILFLFAYIQGVREPGLPAGSCEPPASIGI